jgi:hypothetical protein
MLVEAANGAEVDHGPMLAPKQAHRTRLTVGLSYMTLCSKTQPASA